MKHVQRAELERMLTGIAVNYRLLVPQRLEDGTRLLRPWGEGEPDLSGEPVQRKPGENFLPQLDPLLKIDPAGGVQLAEAPGKPICLFGLNRADLQCLDFVDRFSTTLPQDDAYVSKRRNGLLIGLTGYCGTGGQLLPLADGMCDIELIVLADGWLAQAFSDRGSALLEGFNDAESKILGTLRPLSEKITADERATLEQAAGIVQQELVPDDFWREIGDRCILCSGCNLVCPTCTCFCVQDRTDQSGTERSRVWDSCQFDGFMREASGHNPLGSEALRTRRRIHHKLAADVHRWGEISCFLCGRCDKTCPTGIGIQAVAAEIVKRFTTT
ncbi:MAG: 4Fe-4S dicluster domain-containing protein [Desulfuromonadales bacterium]|nr:4Fe-4S dicluster domain-containing protein [Desulfuromonadales bacterium]